MEEALKTATNLLKHVFDGDVTAVATLITAEAEKNPSAAIHGLEDLISFATNLLNELKKQND